MLVQMLVDKEQPELEALVCLLITSKPDNDCASQFFEEDKGMTAKLLMPWQEKQSSIAHIEQRPPLVLHLNTTL